MKNLILKDKTVIITGASSGIGKASALEFAKHKANVILVARKIDRLKKLEKQMLSKFNIKTMSYQCDVSDKLQVSNLKKTVLDNFDSVDILVNNAGYAVHGSVYKQSIEEIEQQMQTNYFGMVYCVKNFIPKMIDQQSGHIVNVASVAASFGLPGIAPYCASKFAMLGFSEGLKFELQDKGVGVTVVSPIMVKTNFFEHPSFKNKPRSKFSLCPETVAKAIIKACYSSKLEIVVPSLVRSVIWAKHTIPFIINPLVSNSFKKFLEENIYHSSDYSRDVSNNSKLSNSN